MFYLAIVVSPTVQPVRSVLLLLLFSGGRPAGETQQKSHDGQQTPPPESTLIQRYTSPRTSRMTVELMMSMISPSWIIYI